MARKSVAPLLLALLASSQAVPPAAGDLLGLWTCSAASARQQFVLQGGPAPQATVVHSQAAASHLVWDLSGPSSAAGTPVHLWGLYTPAVKNQQWLISGGALQSAYAPGMCLGAGGAFLGAPLALSPCNATDPLQAFSYTPPLLSLPASPSLCVQAGNTTPSCDTPPFSAYPYCNPSLPVADRVADLVGRMTLPELVAAMDSSVPAIPRLGVPSMHSGEALHGAACGCAPQPAPGSTGCPTSFPSPIALGAAMDPDLWQRVGAAIGIEARALANVGPGAMWVFAPNVNPGRDPRCESFARTLCVFSTPLANRSCPPPPFPTPPPPTPAQQGGGRRRSPQRTRS